MALGQPTSVLPSEPGSFLFLIVIHLFLAAPFFTTAAQASVVAASAGCSLAVACSLLIAVASLLAEHGPRSTGSVLWLTGLVALQQVGSSQTRDRTHVSALVGRFLTTGPPGKSLNLELNEAQFDLRGLLVPNAELDSTHGTFNKPKLT